MSEEKRGIYGKVGEGEGGRPIYGKVGEDTVPSSAPDEYKRPVSVNQERKRYDKTKAAKDADPTDANKAEHMKSIGRVKIAESSESRRRSSSKKYENQK